MKVNHVRCSIYDLADAGLSQFDFVHIADVIQHLRDPIKALQQVRSPVKPGGTAHIAHAYDPALPSRTFHYLGGWHYGTWWHPSLDGLAQAVLDAGFASVRLHLRYKLDQTNDQPGTHRAVLVATA